jgi:hypothetical protein
LHDFAGGHRKHEIPRKESELDEHNLGVVQAENGLEMRDQDVVQAGHEAPHEEERGNHRHRGGIA